MQHPTTLLAIGLTQAGAMHRRQLRGAGISWCVEAGYVRSGFLLARPGGILVLAGSLPTWEQRCWIALLTARSGAVLSHRSAAHLHGIGPFGAGPIDVVELQNASNRVERAAPHRSNRLPDHHRTTVRGMPVTSIERTVFDLAGQVSIKRYRRGLPSLRLGQVARALDDAIGGGVAVQRFEAVHDELAGRGRGGTVVLRGLLEERGTGFVATESALEDLLVDVLRRYGLPTPARQRNLGGTDDRVGRVDFVYVDRRLVVEVDGRRNHTALLDREADAWRDLELAAAGFRVVRVSHGQLRNDPERFIAALRRLLAPDSGK